MSLSPLPPSDEIRDTRKTRKIASIAITLLLIATALWGGHALRQQHDGQEPSAPTPPKAVDWQNPAELKSTLGALTASNVAAMHFTTPDGKAFTLADYKGKPLIVNFWATWCPPCVKEMPDLDAMAKAISPHHGVVLVVSLNNTAAEASDWLAAHKLNNVQLAMDSGGKLFTTLPSPSLPLTLLIKPDGTLAERLDGYQKWRSEEVVGKVSALLTNQPAPKNP